MNDVREWHTAEWADCLDVPSMYKVLHGGRGGGKTTEIANKLIKRGMEKSIRVMCCRQFQNSMAESVKPALEKVIYDKGLEMYYKITDKAIVGIWNNTRFDFKGIDRNVMSIKGWEDYDVVWVEEANVVKQDALELLIPTIRKAGSEMWFSFNRHKRTDPVDKFFLGKNPPSNAIIVKIGWQDNPFFPKELNIKRLDDLANQPERYKHIWGGEPDDSAAGDILLPMSKLLKCVDAHKKLGYKPRGRRHIGLDVADAPEGDYNSMTTRKAALVEDVQRWHAPFLHNTATRAHRHALDTGANRLYYDATGMGVGIKSEFSKHGYSRPYSVKPFRFGDQVAGAESVYINTGKKPIYNKDAFTRQNAQVAWNLRLRVERTMRALAGEKVNLDECFFINGDIDLIDEYLLELSQPTFDYDVADKIKIEKKPDDMPSPDMYDSTAMAFAFDIRRGLKGDEKTAQESTS